MEEQLSLVNQFEKLARRDERLVDELLGVIKNFKYFRTNTRFAEVPNRDVIAEHFSTILYWLGFLAFKKARFVESYKGKGLDWFLDQSREKAFLTVTETLSRQTLAEYYLKGESRLKTILWAYKDLLSDDRTITKKIFDNFDQIHHLINVI